MSYRAVSGVPLGTPRTAGFPPPSPWPPPRARYRPFWRGTERKSTLDFHSNGQIPPDDQHALLFIPSGAPTRQNSLRLQPRDAGGVSLLSGRHPRLQCAWISSGTAPEREARTNDCVPFVQYPIYDRSYHAITERPLYSGNDQTSTHAVLK